MCLINEHDKLFKEGFFRESQKLQNIVVSEICKARKEHGAHMLNKLLYSNPKKFHRKYPRSLGKGLFKVFFLLDSNGGPVSEDILNDYFA